MLGRHFGLKTLCKGYYDFMNAQRLRQLKVMFIAALSVFIYSLLAPGVISRLSTDVVFGDLMVEFGILALIFGSITLLCLYQLKSRRLTLPDNKCKAFNICELTSVLMMLGSFTFDCFSLYFAHIEHRGDVYFSFLLTSMLFVSLMYLNPITFTVLFVIEDVIIIFGLKHLDACQSFFSSSYNIVLFGLVLSMLMYVKYSLNYASYCKTKQLDEFRKSRERFLIQITHEMRTPLNAILGKNQVIARETIEPEIRKLAGEIGNSGKIMLSLINDVLDLSKLEAGKMTIIPADYSVAGISEEVASIMRSEAEGHGLHFYMDIADNMPSVLYGDEVRIKQIIMNLLSNAIKYTRAGSVNFRIGFDYGDDDDVILHVSVTDTGIGIKPEDLPRLTEAFTRVDETGNHQTQGTGLGLSITAYLLRLMGSKLSIESTYGDGSTFSFDLTQKIIDRKPFVQGQHESVRKAGETFSAPKARVLVVDDNPVNYSVCRSLMKYYGFIPEYANCSEACINRMKVKQYDIIFLDHFMPEVDGIETLNIIKREMPDVYAKTPIIALTANTSSDAASEYRHLGFTYFLAKPVDAVELGQVLLTFLPESRIVKT